MSSNVEYSIDGKYRMITYVHPTENVKTYTVYEWNQDERTFELICMFPVLRISSPAEGESIE